ncbi:hypothetical protein [Anditalea andensis]|nr:hypothetical protein [Anditalea andensis]
MDRIDVYVINRVNRTDRKASIISEFLNKKELQMILVQAIENPIGAVGLWQTIYNIVGQANKENMDHVVICEDDHIFTHNYSAINLQKAVYNAIQLQADVLLGGISWFTNCYPVGKNLYWVEKFSGLQFAVIFKKFYSKILNTNFQLGDSADYKISSLSDKIYFIHPFISIQRDFGYSDVTAKNNSKDKVEKLFKDSSILVEATKEVKSFYKKKIEKQVKPLTFSNFDHISITTYIINSNDCTNVLSRIHSQFEGRTEFDIRMISLCEHNNPEKAYLITLKKIIQQATEEEEDVIIICDEDHLFTTSYSRSCLIRYIIEAHQLDTKILCGGIDDFETAIPITRDRFWIRTFKSSSFVVLYQSVFNLILRQQISDNHTIECFYRELTSNKMVMFPFISQREGFDGENSERKHNSNEFLSSRLTKIYQIAESSDKSLRS